MVELTYKVLASLEIENYNPDEYVDWAVAMVLDGYETPSLLMLAATTKPANYFETVEIFKDTMRELGIELKSRDEALLSYAYYIVRKIARKEDVRKNLTTLSKLYVMDDFSDTIFDFHRLYWAWGDFDYDDGYGTHYWEGATADNIESLVIEKAHQWIDKYGDLCRIEKLAE